jgi:pimeloyl-ACP methyl ester carboxylesterase
MRSLTNASLGAGWIRLHPDSLENVPEGQDFFASISPETQEGQENVGISWEATNWNGVCDELAKTAKPTLVITGTDDKQYQQHENSLTIAGKIPGAWLVQIKDADHAVMDQYPDEISKILQTFLSNYYYTNSPTLVRKCISDQTIQNSRMGAVPPFIMQS